MKSKLTLFFSALMMLSQALPLSGQNARNARPFNPLAMLEVKKECPQKAALTDDKKNSPWIKNISTPIETTIGESLFDLQSNSTMQKRMYVWQDGTIGVCWTFGNQSPAYADRGTGYNFFNGSAWQSYPNYRIESIKTGWPSYAPLGDSGEIIVAHSGTTSGLVISRRNTKGSGSWNQTTLAGPAGSPNILWPRMITSGLAHDTVHMLALTAPVANAGAVYNGMDGALLYYRSPNGGNTFDKLHIQPTGLTSSNYLALGGDRYAWANPVGDTLAFVVGDTWYDLMLLKSTDGGETWTHTVVFEHPYPFFQEPVTLVTDTPWVCDGGMAVALDKHGEAHICFGLMRVQNTDLTDQTTTYFPFTDGLVYWKEGEAPFTSLDIDSVEARGNLIGWAQDLNGNGIIDYISTGTTAIGQYYLSISSMPQIHVDEMDNVFVVYSSIHENSHNGLQNYRRLYGRGKVGGPYGWDTLFLISSGIIHNYSECVFPSISPAYTSDIHLVYQADGEPGLSVRGDLDPAGINSIVHVSIPKSDFLMSVKRPLLQAVSGMEVGMPFPNPGRDQSWIPVQSEFNQDIMLAVFDMRGKLLMEWQEHLRAGIKKNVLLPAGLPSGMYMLEIRGNNFRSTRKLIRE